MAEPAKNTKLGNFKNQLNDGNTRIKFFGGIIVIVIASIVGYLLLKAGTAKKSSARESTVQNAPRSANTPVDINKPMSPEYEKLVNQLNASAAATALQNGTSSIPVLKGASSPDAAFPEKPEAAKASSPGNDPATAAATREQQQKQDQALTGKIAAMKNQINLLVASWQPKDHSSQQVKAIAQVATNTSNSATSLAKTNAAATTTTTQNTSAQPQVAPLAKAGTVLYAVLDTAVNTDETGPITATIVQDGPLKGSKLLGQVEVAKGAQKAILKFTIASVPGEYASRGINAYAIDPDTTRTALASDVDNHYMLRYGTLFASSFLAGFGDALIKGGQSSSLVSSTSGNVVQVDAYTTKQLLLAGAGNVGKSVATNMSDVINKSPTITINSGIGIGILFMSDVSGKK